MIRTRHPTMKSLFRPKRQNHLALCVDLGVLFTVLDVNVGGRWGIDMPTKRPLYLRPDW